MSDPSPEQESIIDKDLFPLCLIACAGREARLLWRCAESTRSGAKMSGGHGYVALLSFSNTAVDVFIKSGATIQVRRSRPVLICAYDEETYLSLLYVGRTRYFCNGRRSLRSR
jgi:hypothetical protein